MSELLCIHDGLYVVRVTARVDDQTLATGLAAHHRIESAEDEALVRALSHIGSVAIGAGLPTSLAMPPADRPQPPPPSLAPDGPRVKSPITPLPQEEDSPPGGLLSPPSTETYAPSNHGGDGPPWGSPPSVSAPSVSAVPADSTLEDAPAPSFDAALLSLEGIPTPSIDLSDIIAQTDVELQRLGWNVNQGREFLEKNYGKRSRHDLTDEELLAFLLFLETQPSPEP
ncbi:MAG: hypothetical protein VKI82_01560 [Leptolyngbya sp.]|nr:hypothetical protein [Leptolyngbya sp.]